MDVGHLEHIILNLALNARDAMPAGGTLTMRTADIVLEQEYPGRSGRSVGTIVAVEVYARTAFPGEYMPRDPGCGVVVIWTGVS